MPKDMRLGIYNLILSFRFLGGKCVAGDLQPDFFNLFLGGHIEHLNACGQNFISMAVSWGIVWSGLLSQTYFLTIWARLDRISKVWPFPWASFGVAYCPRLIVWTFERVWTEFHKYGHFLGHRLERPIVPDLLCSRVLSSELSRTYWGNESKEAKFPGLIWFTRFE